MLTYQFHTEPDDNDTVLVTVPKFPEVTTFAENEELAPEHAREAIEEAMAARIAAGDDIPAPLPPSNPDDRWVGVSALTTVKVRLYMAMRVKGITRAELQRRLGWHREQVDRLFRLDHSSRMDQLEAAASAVGMRIKVDFEAA